MGDLGPELLLDVREAVLGVLRDVVQEGGGDRDRIEAEVGQDLRRRDGVRDVQLARRPDLAGMGLDGEVERPLHDAEVGLVVVLVERGQQVVAKGDDVRPA